MSIDTIRFYERNKLLSAAARSEGGFRLYSADDLSVLHFIRSLQALGFSLNEIREFIALRRNDLRARSEVGKMLDSKLKDIHAKRVASILTQVNLARNAAPIKEFSGMKSPFTLKTYVGMNNFRVPSS